MKRRSRSAPERASRAQRNRAQRSSRSGSRRSRAARRRWPRVLALVAIPLALATGGWFAVTRPMLGASTLPEHWAPGDWSLPESWSSRAAELRARLRDDPRLQLRSVEFLGLRKLGASELSARLGLVEPRPWIDLDPAASCERLLAHPRIAECRAARLPPDRLLFEIVERVPLGRISDSPHAVDREGRRFPLLPGEAAGLPRMSVHSSRGLELARLARERGVRLRRIEPGQGGSDELWFWPEPGDVRVRGSGNPEAMLTEWLQVEQTDLVRVHGAREVDLRFRGRAVLRFNRDPEGGHEDGSS